MTEIIRVDPESPEARAFRAAYLGDEEATARAVADLFRHTDGAPFQALVMWIDTMHHAQGIDERGRHIEVRTTVATPEGDIIGKGALPGPVRTVARLVECRIRDDRDGFQVILDGLDTLQEVWDVLVTCVHITASTTRRAVDDKEWEW